MSRLTVSLLLFICILGISSCSKVISKQEWSENYALMDGVKSTSPEMIDGNLKTLGKTLFPVEQNLYGGSPSSDVVITLPKKRKISRIVIHSQNLKTFDVLADKGGGTGDRIDWKLVGEVKSVQKNLVDLSLGGTFPTDRIRVRVLSTSDDAELRRRHRARTGGGRGHGAHRRAAGEIFEVELYGYQSAEEIAEKEAEDILDSREKELDDLLK